MMYGITNNKAGGQPALLLYVILSMHFKYQTDFTGCGIIIVKREQERMTKMINKKLNHYEATWNGDNWELRPRKEMFKGMHLIQGGL